MVYRNYHVRYTKWSQKFDPDTIRSRFSQVKDIATEQVQELFADLVDMETRVKDALNEQGAPVIAMPFYLDVAREVWSATKRHTGKTLGLEVQAIKSKWVARGLDPDLVDLVIKTILGYIPSY